MAATNTLSTTLTNRDAGIPHAGRTSGGRLIPLTEYVAIADEAEVGSTYRFFQINSSMMIRDLWIRCPDIGTTTAANIGLYDTTENGSAVVDADFFASAVDLASGALADTNITFESGVISLANCTKRLWELLYAASIISENKDPKKNYDVVLTLTGAADAAGGVRLKMDCVQG